MGQVGNRVIDSDLKKFCFASQLTNVLVECSGGCTLEQAGHHVRAVDLVMRKLEIETVADACRDPANGQWCRGQSESGVELPG